MRWTWGVLISICVVLCISGYSSSPTQSSNTDIASKLVAKLNQNYYLAQQDQNPMISLMHISQAATYLSVLHQMIPNGMLQRACGDLNIQIVAQDLTRLQNEMTREINVLYPKLDLPEIII
jgi:hypothetical protein